SAFEHWSRDSIPATRCRSCSYWSSFGRKESTLQHSRTATKQAVYSGSPFPPRTILFFRSGTGICLAFCRVILRFFRLCVRHRKETAFQNESVQWSLHEQFAHTKRFAVRCNLF